jgi:phosphatidylglycerol:prolipoprotein diacylglycerol transferase
MAIPFPNITPEILTIPLGPMSLTLRWYALAYIAGLVIGWRVIMGLMRRPKIWGGQAPMVAEGVEDLLSWVILGVIVGGRLGFVLFYEPAYYLANPAEIVQVWKGGMAFHGGLIGVVVAGLLYCRKHGIAPLSIGDSFALVAPFGLALGRVANFINAELWGRPTDVPWAVIFPGEAAQTCLSIAGQIDGQCGRHPSQLYEAGLEGIVLALILWGLLKAGALMRPGLIMGVFIAGYGLARFAVEFVRQADARFITYDNPMGWVVHFGGFGLSMGQVLSLPMIAIGLWFVWRAKRGSVVASRG